MTTVAAPPTSPPGCKVTLGGGPLDPTLGAQLLEVRVETTTALPDVCTLRFAEAGPAQATP